MSYQLENIEAVKTTRVSIPLNAVTTGTPYVQSQTKQSLNLNFTPDYVKVKHIMYIDNTNASSGVFLISANFIRDNDILCSVMSPRITASGETTPDLLHKFVDTNQLQFTVTGTIANTTSATAVVAITLEFVKLREARQR